MTDNFNSHSAGPWSIEDEGPDGEILIKAKCGRIIGVIDQSTVQLFDARLISAAPDMLKALMDLEHVIYDEIEDREACGDEDCEYVRQLSEPWERAVKAMQKARFGL